MNSSKQLGFDRLFCWTSSWYLSSRSISTSVSRSLVLLESLVTTCLDHRHLRLHQSSRSFNQPEFSRATSRPSREFDAQSGGMDVERSGKTNRSEDSHRLSQRTRRSDATRNAHLCLWTSLRPTTNWLSISNIDYKNSFFVQNASLSRSLFEKTIAMGGGASQKYRRVKDRSSRARIGHIKEITYGRESIYRWPIWGERSTMMSSRREVQRTELTRRMS